MLSARRTPLFVALALALYAAPLLAGAPSDDAPPGRGSVEIHAPRPRAARWQRAFDALPDVWRCDEAVVAREVSPEEMGRLVGHDGRLRKQDDDYVVDGYFERGKDDLATIVLSADLSDEESEMVFLHEYGHLVWEDNLDGRQRQEYRGIWRDQRKRGHLVSEYARESVEEGFAEAFAHLQLRPALLRKRDAETAAFLRRVAAMAEERRREDDEPED